MTLPRLRWSVKARRSIALLCALVVALGQGRVAVAEESASRLEVRPAIDLSLAGTAAAAWVTTELLKGRLAPAACRWCEPNAMDDSVARAAAWGDLHTPARLSDVGLFAVVPAASLGLLALAAHHDDRLQETPVDLLLVAESVALAQLLNQATKFAAGRERPFVHWLPEDEKTRTSQPSDNNLSFFSGHTTMAFALVSSSYTVARERDYRWSGAILAAGLPLAASIGYLRMAAGKHYLTDVLLGAAVGTAVGVAVPLLHRTEGPQSAVLAPTSSGLSLSGQF